MIGKVQYHATGNFVGKLTYIAALLGDVTFVGAVRLIVAWQRASFENCTL